MIIRSSSFGNQRDNDSCGARETVGSQGSANSLGYKALLQGLWALIAKECRKPKREVSLTDPVLWSAIGTRKTKRFFKAIKNAIASLTQELEKCKTNLDESNSALGEAISCRDSCLIALQNKQNEFEKYKAFNDRTIDYEILQTKLNETLGLLALKDI
ncbi:hypothetical protein Tco_0749314 [Tanacetum coccineum]|uniref:Uncharacterized protein n=1 Tax=Tanacetum coccineum TaxID=301880 RepID=A0ABQ4Z131_9ASTR